MLRAAMAATWPAAETRRVGPWLLRRDGGGGRRVSAATLEGPFDGSQAAAAAAMRGWGQAPLFQIWPETVRPGNAALDAALEAEGYRLHDATRLMAAPVAVLATAPWDVSVIAGPAPIALMREIWAAGGIGPGRVAVMERAAGPRAFLFGRLGDRPAACAFVACHGRTAMLHGLEVVAGARRQGVGTAVTRAAAAWAGTEGAEVLALAVLAANTAARAAYGRAGMQEAGRYHYRTGPPG